MLTVLAVFFLSSCSSPKRKLIGTWKVSKVETNFKNTKLPPNIIAHIKEEQKQISFEIVNDSVMVLMLDNNAHEAKWILGPKDKSISYYFSHQKNTINKLGVWNGNTIVSKSNTPLGQLIVIYAKK